MNIEHHSMQLLEGNIDRLGAHVVSGGINFAVFSEHAQKIELCLFDSSGMHEVARLPMHGPEHGIFHGFLANTQAGLIYAYRAHGPYDPHHGHRFNPNKILLDPYAREIVGQFEWKPEHHGYIIGDPEGMRSFDTRDNSQSMLKARVTATSRKPELFRHPRHKLRDLVLYEVHVKGFSKTHPDIPEELRGTYAALAHPASIAYFKSLGVTTLSLLPVHYCISEPGLEERGVSNYWGYNTLGFFCVDPRWSQTPHDTNAANEEFRKMVRTLHVANIEVLLDVVYNHTPEGNEWGPTLSMRGLDNVAWYRLQPQHLLYSENLTGCGNTINAEHPQVARFILDSLRYWVEEMGVDGFRFDLAPILARNSQGFNPQSIFFTSIAQDPVLSGVHMIAEPWDAGHDGYQVGRFPGKFLEWNDKFRDAIRGYWLRSGVSHGEFARRFTASSDVFHHHKRLPNASVNFISVHDGFTLLDTVSYSRKHNHANGEQNRDGRDNELCSNFGVEGPTHVSEVLQTRRRVHRAMMASLLLAQGTPMLCAGDEIGKTQLGNNNAYCQDNPISWLNWQTLDREFHQFVTELLQLRREEPLLHYSRWFSPCPNVEIEPQLHWLRADSHYMQTPDWHDTQQHALICLIEAAKNSDAGSKKIWLAFNPSHHEVDTILPDGIWEIALDSSNAFNNELSADHVTLPAHSVVVLRDRSPHHQTRNSHRN
jgi:isoamylase